MEKKFRTQFDTKQPPVYEFTPDVAKSSSSFTVELPISSLLIEHNDVDDSDTHISDVRLLFHQKDIENQIGVDNVRRLLANLSTNVARGQSTRVQNMDDNALMAFIKDKNIQHLSEIRAYSHYLNSVAENMEQQAQDIVKEYQETLSSAASSTAASADAASVSE